MRCAAIGADSQRTERHNRLLGPAVGVGSAGPLAVGSLWPSKSDSLLAGAPAAENLARQRSVCVDDVRVVVADQLAVDDHGVDAGGVGDQSVRLPRQVVDAAQRAGGNGAGIEDDDVRRQTDGETAAIGDPEHLGGARRQHANGIFQAEGAGVADPVPEQVRRKASIAELAGVCAGVGEAENHVWILQQLGHRRFVEIDDRHAEARRQIRVEGEVEQEVDRVDTALACNLVDGAFFERAILRA